MIHKYCLLFLFSCFMSCSLWGQADSIQYYLDQAEQSFSSGDYTAAIQAYRLAKTFVGDLPYDIDLQLNKAYEAYTQLLNEENELAERLIKAYELNQANPTKAIRIASSVAQANSPQSVSAKYLVRDIINKTTSSAYALRATYGFKIKTIAVSPLEDVIAVGGEYQYVLLINPVTNAVIDSISTGDAANRVTSLDFSENGNRLLIGTSRNEVHLTDIANRRTQLFAGHQADLTQLAFLKNDQQFISTDWSGEIILWNTSGAIEQRFKAHDHPILGLAVSSNGDFFVTTDDAGQVKIWNKSAELLQSFKAHEGPVPAVALDQDGYIITIGWDKYIRKWTRTGELKNENILNADLLSSLAIGIQEKLIIVGDTKGRIIQLDQNFNELTNHYAHKQDVNTLTLAPRSNAFLISGGDDNQLFIWYPQGAYLSSQQLARLSEELNCFALRPSHDLAVYGGKDSTVFIQTGETLMPVSGLHKDRIQDICIDPSGQYILTASQDNTSAVISTKGELVRSFKSITGDLNTADFSPDGTTYAVGGRPNLLFILDLKDDAKRDTILEANRVYAARFSPDGQRIVTGIRRGLVSIRNSHGDSIYSFQAHANDVTVIAFFANGNFLTGSTDQSIKEWTPNGELIRTYTGHTAKINSLYTSKDNAYFVSSSDDGTARLWDTTGVALQTISSTQSSIVGAVLSDDNKTIEVILENGNRLKYYTVEGFLNDGRVADIPEADLFISEEEEVKRIYTQTLNPEPTTNSYLYSYQKNLYASENNNDLFFRSMALSRAAYQSQGFEERIAYIQSAIMHYNKVFSVNTPGTRNNALNIQYHLDHALYLCGQNKPDEAATLVAKVDSLEGSVFIPLLKTVRRVIIDACRGNADQAIENLADQNLDVNLIEQGGFRQFIAITRGLLEMPDNYTLREYLVDDINLLESEGLQNDGLSKLKRAVIVHP